MSATQFGQRAVFKYAQHTGAQYVGGRYTPGTFTNQIQKRFVEPRLLLAADPLQDTQPVLESSYVNIPVIAFCNTDCPAQHIDCAIPCNNISKNSVALMFWLLAREVLRMRGVLLRSEPWNVMVDLFMYRDPEEAAEEVLPEPAVEDTPVETAPATDFAGVGVGGVPKVAEWGAEEGAGFVAPVAGDPNWQGGAAAAAAPGQAANWQAQTTGAPGWDQTSAY